MVIDYPRVTEILSPYGPWLRIPKDTLENAAYRGTKVHSYCASIARNVFISEGMIEPEYNGYVESFRKWSEAQVKEFLVVEKRYVYDKLRYTGQVDYVARCSDDKLYLIDLKTTVTPQKTHRIQMAAYDLLLRFHDIRVAGAMLVYLDRGGEFPEVRLLDNLHEELHVFLCALDVWHYLHRRKKDDRTSTASLSEHNEFTPENPGDNAGPGLHTEG